MSGPGRGEAGSDAAPGARFPADVLVLLDRELEVTIETRAADGSPRRPVIIWAVVDGGEVFVRSYLGAAGRWYRDLVARPEAVIEAGGRRIAVRALPAADADSVERCSRALRAKYRDGASRRAMLREDVLGTTLRLVPA